MFFVSYYMKLSKNWITEGLIDFEYKQYLLLAFLKKAKEDFEKHELYPSFSDLIFHYNSLLNLKETKEDLSKEFPKSISQIDLGNLRIQYDRIVKDDEVMKEIEVLIDFAIPAMKNHLEFGKELYEGIKEEMELTTVGIQPRHKIDGLLFLKRKTSRLVRIFNYSVKSFYEGNTKYRGINLTFLKESHYSFVNTLESMKVEILKNSKSLMTPATFLIEHGISGSFWQSTYPIAKRMLIQEVNQ